MNADELKPAAVTTGKARPPRAIVEPPVVHANGRLTCKVSFDAGNGVPDTALLLPVEKEPGASPNRWAIVRRDGSRLAVRDALSPADLENLTHRIAPRDVCRDAVRITLPWPGGARHALLLLVHSQLEAIGDETYLLPVDLEQPTLFVPLKELEPDAQVQRVVTAASAWLHIATALELERGVLTLRPRPASPADRAFALASCQYPAGMLDGGSRDQRGMHDDRAIGPAERSLWRLGHELEEDVRIAFTVLAGDQVYVDATAGLFDPAKLLDRFSFAYQAMRDNKGLQRVLRIANHALLPLLDDHELDSDNWEPAMPHQPTERQLEDLKVGLRNYRAEQAPQWPAPPRNPHALWETRTVDGWAFFFADTRTLRTGRNIANWRTASILGEQQEAALLNWIAAGAGDTAPRFIASPSILLPRLLQLQGHGTACLTSDSWSGYPRSLQSVLARICETRARGIVFLSGDEHLSCVARIAIWRKDDAAAHSVVTHSVHGSALYAPYPFANSVEADFAANEFFEFDHPDPATGAARRYVCAVETTFSPLGDGFVILRPTAGTSGDWQLCVHFLGGAGGCQPQSYAL